MATDDWQVPAGFPALLSDGDLEAALIQMTIAPRTSTFANVNTALQAALVQVGVADQQRRHAEAAARSSRIIACVSIAIALVAVGLSVLLGALSYRGDQDWQDQQTRLLTEIRDRLASQP